MVPEGAAAAPPETRGMENRTVSPGFEALLVPPLLNKNRWK